MMEVNRVLEWTIVVKFVSDEARTAARCVRVRQSRDSAQRGAKEPMFRAPVRARVRRSRFCARKRVDAPRTRYAKRWCGKGRTRLRMTFMKRGACGCSRNRACG